MQNSQHAHIHTQKRSTKRSWKGKLPTESECNYTEGDINCNSGNQKVECHPSFAEGR